RAAGVVLPAGWFARPAAIPPLRVGLYPGIRWLEDAVDQMDRGTDRGLARLHCSGGAGSHHGFALLYSHEPTLKSGIRWTKPCARFPSRPSSGNIPFPWEAASWIPYRSALRRSPETRASSFFFSPRQKFGPSGASACRLHWLRENRSCFF